MTKDRKKLESIPTGPLCHLYKVLNLETLTVVSPGSQGSSAMNSDRSVGGDWRTPVVSLCIDTGVGHFLVRSGTQFPLLSSCLVCFVLFVFSSTCLLYQWMAVTTCKNKLGKLNLVKSGFGLGESTGLDFPWRLCQEGLGSGLVLAIKIDP